MSGRRVRDLDPHTLRACAAELERSATIDDGLATDPVTARLSPGSGQVARAKRAIASIWIARAERLERRRG